MARFFTIASSSSGNSYYAGCSSGGLLIDAGVCGKTIFSGLERAQVIPDNIFGVLITHEHIDHIRGLAAFLKKCPVPVYASDPVLDFLSAHGAVPPGAVLKEISADGELIGPMLVLPFQTSHDSVGSLGFRISTPDDRRIAVATDTGYITSGVHASLLHSDLVLIESNYEPSMLENGRYPYPLKRRIAGPCGHLSNQECADLLPELVRSGTTRMILAHLSKENNFPELARQTSADVLSESGMRDGSDFLLSVAPRDDLSPITVF